MKSSKTFIWISVVVIALLAFAGGWSWYSSTQPGKYDEFASCLQEKNATFFGAFWCPHCQAQKALFGAKSAKKLPYVECSTPDGNNRTQICIDANITAYPTWEFADGTRLTGEVPLDQLAEKSGCMLPK